MSPLDEASLSLAQRLHTGAAQCVVVSRHEISPVLSEITLAGDPSLAGVPGNDVMVQVPRSSSATTRRRFSVHDVDRDNGTFTLWVTTDHEGPGVEWARTSQPGDQVNVVGPRGKITLDPLADWYLFVGDVSALGVFYRMARAVETPGQVIFLIEVDSVREGVTRALPEGLGVTAVFVERQGRAHDDPSGLLLGLAALELPEGEGHAYLFGEFHCVRAARAALEDRGLAASQISLKAFWRTGRANADNGEPERD